MKLRDIIAAGRASAAAVVFLLPGCSPVFPERQGPLGSAEPPPAAAPEALPKPISIECRADGWTAAAQTNADTLQTLAWTPFGRPETGWDVYATLIQHEIGTTCPPNSEGFARALADWERRNGQTPDGVMTEPAFLAMKGVVQTRRDFVRFTSGGTCPDTPDLITAARLDEGYGGKQVWMRPKALEAYRRMAATARAEVPEIAGDPRSLTIFSGYRSPSADAARCQAEGNCDGIVRARCSAHRTGLAADLYVGQAPGYGPDSSADPNRLFMTQTAAYRWLVQNAWRFGFVNYPFEPWHWEWTGEQP